MSCVNGADHCGRPAWATVGMDMTEEELRKVLESNGAREEPWTGLLDGLACGVLVLCLVVLLAYLIHQGLKWTRTQLTQRETQGGCKVEDLTGGLRQQGSETFRVKMEALEERLAALEKTLQRVSRLRLKKLSHTTTTGHVD